MSWAAGAIVLSFARGRARHVARELVDLEFRMDVESLTANGALRLLRPQRDQLRREIERCVRLLGELAMELDPADALRQLIERTCRSYHARGAAHADGRESPEIAWALALHDLETATARRPA
jgi:hypothetical protein